MRRVTAISVTLVLIAIVLSPGVALSQSTGGNIDARAAQLAAQMTPEQKIGQLFLVTYYGSDTGPNSDIATLIARYHVGGVVLSAENGNFTDLQSIPDQVAQLVTGFQTMAFTQSSDSATQTPQPSPEPGPDVPLLIGVNYDGANATSIALQSGMSPLPTNMAIGATWDADNAEKTGQVLGQEMSSVGVNFLLGLSADVVEVPQPYTPGDLGTTVFGGEPFWVSRMVAAYVRGIHEGSGGRMAVVVGHFPGHGAADRLATVEVPIVRRSLDQLTQFDLIPFFAVTDSGGEPLNIADGLLAGHISYRGFQGDNPRVATRPISLDPQALQALLKLDRIAKWRAGGGLVVSDSLGVRGVRRFYDPQEATFRNRRIAQDALLAGNDILYLDQFGSNPPQNQAATIEDTIDFFVQAYQADPAFQARVDDALKRILRKKLQLYGEFDLNKTVLAQSRTAEPLGQHADIAFNVAQNAVTLLSPSKPDLLSSPQAGDRIVIFTDTRPIRFCDNCAPHPTIPVDSLQAAILKFYGPQASALVRLESIQSFTFDQLATFLQNGPPTASDGATPAPDSLAIALGSADWIVFVMQNVDPAVPSSNTVKQFLAAPSIAPHAQDVVMAMKGPYYLDSTEISKLAAYYGLYGTSSPFIDVAARALFLGVSLDGASPVSVSGINYGILDATSPNPSQVIKLSVETGLLPEQVTATSLAVPVLGKGDTLRLLTGSILDWNGRPVPDGTPVDFVVNYAKEGLRNSTSVTTVDGIASTSLLLDRPGEVEVTVQSGLARQSDTVKVFIPDSGSISVTVLPPDVAPTPTLRPSDTPGAVNAVGTNLGELGESGAPGRVSPRVGFADWFVSVLGLLGFCGTMFWYGYKSSNLNQGLLLALPALVCGLMGYIYFALLLPGSGIWYQWFGNIWSAGFATWLSSLIGLVLTIVFVPWNGQRSLKLFNRRLGRG